MKYLLAAINAKYIHSNPGIYSLKRYAEERLAEASSEVILPEAAPSEAALAEAKRRKEVQSAGKRSLQAQSIQIELGEYTINHQMEKILQDIYRRSPDVAGFSCYIWNIVYVKELVKNIKKVLPDIRIWLGGPEVSYDAEQVLEELPETELVMMGEGEETFFRLVKLAESQTGESPDEEGKRMRVESFFSIPGIAFRDADGRIVVNKPAPPISPDALPHYYDNLDGLEHRIVYYESSRGCPFSCSYCLSSIDKRVRFRSLELVKRELSSFLEQRVPQVKFIDRTFNCNKSHALEIWRFLLEHDNGVTNFHFEISADLLEEEELEVISRMRPGLIQLEIGVQTTNPDTIREIRRKMDLSKLARNVARVRAGRNVHQHLDLIAGLPFENPERFRRSFDEVYRMKPDQLQLGFLKVLKGSYMEEKAEDYGLLYQSQPPYEVLSTRWMDYEDIILLKGVEEMVEVYYNSGQFHATLEELEREFETPFSLYEALAQYYEAKKLSGISHNRLARYEILYHFIRERQPVTGTNRQPDARLERYRDLLMYDLYLRENMKSRPFFARDPSGKKDIVKRFFIKEAAWPLYLNGYEGYDSRQLAKMAHMEAMGDGSYVLFDYKNRDALSHNARAFHLTAEQVEGRE